MSQDEVITESTEQSEQPLRVIPPSPVVPPRQVSEIECSMCGRDGGPYKECALCFGNKRFIQTRSFSLSEERQGLNPDANKDRYGITGDVSPQYIALPGGFVPGQGSKS